VVELTITFCNMIDAIKIGSNLDLVPIWRRNFLKSMFQISKWLRKLTLWKEDKYVL